MIKCKYCGVDTHNEGTMLCGRCWELSSKISMAPRLLLTKIIHAERKDVMVIQSGRFENERNDKEVSKPKEKKGGRRKESK